MKVYGQTDPPEYKVEDVNVPIATYWGENDYLASKEVGIVGSGYAYSSFQISTLYFTQNNLVYQVSFRRQETNISLFQDYIRMLKEFPMLMLRG